MNPLDIRALRLGLKYTQARLGLWVGVHASSVGRWERGRHRPRARHIDRLRELQQHAQSETPGEAETDPVLRRRETASDRGPAKRNAAKRNVAKRNVAKRNAAKRNELKRSTAKQIATIRAALSARATSASTVEHGDRWELHHGDLFDVVPTLPPEHFDALIVDLPYSSGGLHIGTRQQSTHRKYQGARIQH